MRHFQAFRTSLIIIIFAALISFPFINRYCTIVADIDTTENRKAAAIPEFAVSRINDFPGEYEAYHNDNFSLRQRAVKWYNWLVFNVFRKSPLPNKVTLGRNGWLYMAGTEYECFDGSNNLTDKELNNIRKELEYRKEYHEARGRKFYFMVAPVKANIYPEFLPDGSAAQNTPGLGESLIAYLNKESSVKPINIFPLLRRQKQKGQLYYKLDNHWNEKGGLVAAEYILQILSEEVKGVETIQYQDFVQKDSSTASGNLEKMLSNVGNTIDSANMLTPRNGFRSQDAAKADYPAPETFPYPWEYEMVREKHTAKKPAILIISDSFGGNLFPFIAEGFGRSVKLFDAWEYKRNEDIIAKEKPDVVLVMVLESKLRLLGKKK